MLQLNILPLDTRAARRLQIWQNEVDTLAAYPLRVQKGKDKFGSRNKKSNATFNHVKSVLTKMCQGARRCSYCEDSVADEIEHIYPKDLYPEFVFSWDNYVYACGPCNNPKNNQFAVLTGSPLTLHDVTRPSQAPIVPPLRGNAALINPRAEDPLHFLILDLLNTFAFDVRDHPSVTIVDKIRAQYTIEILRLNSRDYLVDARRTAFGTYRARLVEYITEKKSGASPADLGRRRDELLKVGHRTVWREIQRQHSNYSPLRALFADAPEALTW